VLLSNRRRSAVTAVAACGGALYVAALYLGWIGVPIIRL
jgi:hypothetical protein